MSISNVSVSKVSISKVSISKVSLSNVITPFDWDQSYFCTVL